MAVKTIKVDITGLDKIANAEKSISSLRNAVLGIEKDLKGMSGRRNSPLSFYIELKFNEDKVKQDYLKIKNMIENIPINVRSKEGRVDLKQSNRIPRDSGYVRVRDQDYQSWRNLHKAIGDVSTASLNLMSTMTKLGAVNPAKGLLSVFNQINSKAMELHGNLMSLVGGKLQGGLQSAISGVLSGVRSGIGQITQETENIGNAMQVFRVNMGALGFDEKEINKSMKRLGDYGKATVFDASDLLEQASTYYAYNRKDAEDIVKGISGLVAQTKDPVQGLKSVGIQVSQMLAAGKLNQQDFRFMRERFSALGASEVNDRLLALSKSKGYNTIIDATRHGDISSDEVLDIFKELGNSEKFQSLVTSILTPRQALDNLKETLGNLFVFDQIDDEGNATPGALNKVYVATRDFIKGITEIVGTDTFEQYVKRLGDSIGTTIQKVNQFGKVVQLRFGKDLLSTINTFSKDFSKGIKGQDISKIVLDSIKDVMTFFNTNGNRIGSFLKTLITNIAELGDTALSVATDAIGGGLLDAIAGIVKVYDNIGKLAVNTGAVKAYASAMQDITNAFNKVLEYAQNLKSLQNLALSIKDFISTVTSVASDFVINTGVIDNLAQVINAVVRTLSTVLANVSKTINYPRAQSAFKQIKDTIISLLNNVEPIIEEIVRSAINVATSQAGVNFFKAVSNFVQAVVNAIQQTLISIGGSVEGGLTKLLNIVTSVVDFASKVASLLGVMGKYVIMGFVATKFLSWATGIISSLTTVATAMNNVSGGRLNPLGLGQPAITPAGGSSGIPIVGGAVGSAKSIKRAYSLSRTLGKSIPSSLMASAKVGTTLFKNSGFAKGLAGIFADVAIGGANAFIQNSGAPSSVKKGVNVVANVASSSIGGATLGSIIAPGIGTIIGSVAGGAWGLVQGIMDNNAKDAQDKLDKVAEKEYKKQQNKLQYDKLRAHVEQIKELGKETSRIQDNFFASVLSGNPNKDILANSLTLISGVKGNSNGDLSIAQSSLGLAVSKIPKGIDEYFVELNGKLSKWSELKEQYGVDDATLLASIQNLYSAMGKPFIEFKDQAGNVIDSVDTLSKGEQERRNTELAEFVKSYEKLGLTVREGLNIVWGDIGSLRSKLEFSLNGNNFANKEDKAEAIIKSFEEVGFNVEMLKGKKVEEIEKFAKAILDSNEFSGKSVKEANNDKMTELINRMEKAGTEIDDKVREKLMKNLEQYTGEELDELLKVFDLLDEKGDKNDIENSFIAGEYQEKLEQLRGVVDKGTGKIIKGKLDKNTKYINDWIAGLQQGDSGAVYADAEENITNLLNSIGIKNKELQASILSKLQTGVSKTLEEAIIAVQKETIEHKPDETISLKATELYNALGALVENNYITLDTAKKALERYDPKSVDTSSLDKGGKDLFDKVKGTVEKHVKTLRDGSNKLDPYYTSQIGTEELAQAGNDMNRAVENLINNAKASIQRAVESVKGKTIAIDGGNLGTINVPMPTVGVNRWLGGIIPEYHSKGLPVGIDWKRRGTDTVPAMLTPGEYVLRKKAVDSLGTNFLNNLNKYGAQALQTVTKSTIINNVYNTNNAKINQTIDNKSEYLNGMYGVDKLMRYV